jgi:very-short-patch-repair endonuclease
LESGFAMKNAKKSFAKWKEKMKRKEWAEARYGDSWELKKQQKLEENAKKMRKNMTAPEKIMATLLKELKIPYESQVVLGEFIYDFRLTDSNILIEVDGDYYHGNPAKYDDKDLNAMQRKNKRTDQKKNMMAGGLKYKLLRFWECDIQDKGSTVKEEIKKHIDGTEK